MSSYSKGTHHIVCIVSSNEVGIDDYRIFSIARNSSRKCYAQIRMFCISRFSLIRLVSIWATARPLMPRFNLRGR